MYGALLLFYAWAMVAASRESFLTRAITQPPRPLSSAHLALPFSWAMATAVQAFSQLTPRLKRSWRSQSLSGSVRSFIFRASSSTSLGQLTNLMEMGQKLPTLFVSTLSRPLP